jgi:hypothetical protein
MLPVTHAADHATLLGYVLDIREAHPVVKNSSRISLIVFETRWGVQKKRICTRNYGST